MIIQQPDGNLKNNLIVLGAEIIFIMKKAPFKNKLSIVDDVMNKFLHEDKGRTPSLFLDALVFLYALGIIAYKGYKIKLIKNVNQNTPKLNLY